jgi:NTP pyrophosphatase (non-canonical NTP hydrolase)
MNFDEYQKLAIETASPANDAAMQVADFYVYPGSEVAKSDVADVLRMHYGAMGLCSEAGEVAGKVKKIMRDDYCNPDAKTVDALASEIGDVLWYVAYICDVIGIDMSEVASRNLFKLRQRASRGTLTGSGDQR